MFGSVMHYAEMLVRNVVVLLTFRVAVKCRLTSCTHFLRFASAVTAAMP